MWKGWRSSFTKPVRKAGDGAQRHTRLACMGPVPFPVLPAHAHEPGREPPRKGVKSNWNHGKEPGGSHSPPPCELTAELSSLSYTGQRCLLSWNLSCVFSPKKKQKKHIDTRTKLLYWKCDLPFMDRFVCCYSRCAVVFKALITIHIFRNGIFIPSCFVLSWWLSLFFMFHSLCCFMPTLSSAPLTVSCPRLFRAGV